ncbi:histidinol-phosphatase [Paenibacillus donghaensis]|uniref:histidinol-phosphatase n=1 Tax=Paenibacillus donghaensis TaxID=414771 RepID=UPI001470D7FA|nr:histidinol-phosphatase [Paenibacillus donghaensis]
MFDLHTHHERCGHAVGSLEDYIEKAIAKDVQILGISDHSPYFFADEDQPYPGLAMAKSEFSNYVEEIMRLKKKYEGHIELLIGVESDVFKEYIHLYGQVYARFPLDYVIGSIHFTSPFKILKGLDWNAASDQERQTEFKRFMELTQLIIQSNWVNIIGHLDRFNRGFSSFAEMLAPHMDSILKMLAEKGVALEVNTSGFRNSEVWYPSMEVIERAHFFGLDVTFASDAHHPDRIGDGWEMVRDILRNIGYKRWVIFRQRRPVYLDIQF